MRDSLLLVFANKQDVQGGMVEMTLVDGIHLNVASLTRLMSSIAMTPAEVTEHLQLNKLKDTIWYVVPSCATTGEGLFEGLVCSSRLISPSDIHSNLASFDVRDGYQTMPKHPHNANQAISPRTPFPTNVFFSLFRCII